MLKTDYKDAMYDGARKYKIISNADGTSGITDETVYTQEGDPFGANDINATNKAINRINGEPANVILTASGWTGSAAPYSQTVTVEGVTAEDNPIFVSLLADGASADTQKAYMKAFGIIASGTGTTADGAVTFKVYKKPEIDITIGLKGGVTMGRVLMTGGGGGADLDVITAAADDVLSGKVIVDKDGNPLTGTLTLSGNAGAADVLSGKTFYTTNPKSKQTGTMGTLAGGTYTPSTSQQTISCSGKKMTSNVIIKGDSNLVAGNILNGKSIFGVTGNVRKVAKLTKQYSTNGSGTFTCNGNNGSSYLPYLTVSGFGFTPAAVIATVWASSGLQLTACDGSNYAVHSTGYNYMINSGAAKFAYNNLVIPVGSSGTHWVKLYGYY